MMKKQCQRRRQLKKKFKIVHSVACLFWLPIRGTASDVVGIIAETRFMKTVSDRRTVTSARGIKIKAQKEV